MTWFTGLIVYILVWWLTLFAVLPFWTRPVADPDSPEHFSGAPEKPMLLRKVVATTLVSGVIWLGIWAIIESDLISFRAMEAG
jgi:predicted secreted protein